MNTNSYQRNPYVNKEVANSNQQPKSNHDQLSSILSRSIPERCSLLNNLLKESSTQDLSNLFSYIVEDIFGFGGNHVGWGVMNMAKTRNLYHFSSLFEFLSPKGPLISTAYKLLADGRVQYQFPVSYLPMNTQRLLEEGNFPPLYNHKIPYSGPGRMASYILLNPFEFYFFHFAYVVVNPSYSKGAVFPSTMSDSLYPCILEEYLHYFLSLDSVPSITPIPFSNNYGYSNPMMLAFQDSPGFSPYSNQSFQHLPNNPLQQSIYSTERRGYLEGNPPERFNKLMSRSEFANDDVWRSQSLILILVEFWLNLSNDDSPNIIFNPVAQESFVPSHCQMQLVRHLVKHLHHFTNSALTSEEKVISNLSFETNNPWNEFKKNVVSQCVQKKLYIFLKLSLSRWPLDSTFRFPLETWLSYIQPWRYERTEYGYVPHPDIEQSVDNKWEKFVAENLLFYSVIFQKLLPCFLRVELSSPRLTYLLSRVTKVFSLPNLRQMILEAENKLQEPDLSQLSSSFLFQSTGTNANSIHSQIRQKIYELEGLGFIYKPMFGSNVRGQVLKLLIALNKAKQTAITKIIEISEIRKSWWVTFVEFFKSNEYETREVSMTDLRKQEAYLNSSSGQLCSMFHLSLTALEESILQNTEDSTSALEETSFSSPSRTISKLPKDRISFRNVKYEGNPDLQPIRSFEVAFLVRLLYQISTVTNEKYQDDITLLYSRTDYLGRFARQFLAPPVVCKKNNENESFCALPPRVSLRILAHRQLLAYLLVFYTFSWVFGFGLVQFIMCLVLIVIIFASISALFSNPNPT